MKVTRVRRVKVTQVMRQMRTAKHLEELFGKECLVLQGITIAMESTRRRQKLMKKAILLGMYHDTYLCKRPYRVPVESGIQWVQRTLRNANSCYDMFRMQPHVWERLH